MDYIPFNSRLKYHKSEFGAVTEGRKIVFRIVLPRSLQCHYAFLSVASDSGEKKLIPMEWERMEGENEEWWSVDFSAEKRGLYWYRFILKTAYGDNAVTKVEDSKGRISSDGEDFQLTVYSADFRTPDWIKGSVIYQIFPDRFCFSGKKKKTSSDRIIRSDWGGKPMWNPDADGKITEYDFFQGDFEGIRSKLDYLGSLGIGCIYLNPIFSAQSNHRYDTADYESIDSLLGDEKDFRNLCADAEKYGIKVIIDGVFSHTGADSVYFNKEKRYGDSGAYNDKNSPYFPWYRFKKFPDEYDCWWDVDILPEIDEENDSYIEYMAGENGILRKWLRAGASGWRLDVADELPDKFLDALRIAVRDEKEDAFILGEVWEDASNKISYGSRRRYLEGGQLDSVMNYPFANALIDFAITGVADGFNEKIETICENYPKPAVDTLMNHIGTHDTCRVLNRLATLGNYESNYLDRYQGGLTDEEYSRGIKLLKLVSSMQFTLPGVPCIYYGDEAGTDGGEDPFNRGCYPWEKENKEIIEHYRFLGELRKKYKVFREGAFEPVSSTLGCIAYKRTGIETIMTVANRNSHPIDYVLPEYGWKSLTGETVEGKILHLGAESAAILILE